MVSVIGAASFKRFDCSEPVVSIFSPPPPRIVTAETFAKFCESTPELRPPFAIASCAPFTVRLPLKVLLAVFSVSVFATAEPVTVSEPLPVIMPENVVLPVWLMVRFPVPIDTVPPTVTLPVTMPAVSVLPSSPPPLRLPIVSVELFTSRMALALFASCTVERSPIAPPTPMRSVPSLMLVAPV